MCTNIHTRRPDTPLYQKGGITILMSLMMLISITMLSIYSTGYAVMDQRISANEYRAMEVDQAASAGLDYALIWLGTAGNNVSWSSDVDSACSGTFDQGGEIDGPDISSSSSYTYELKIYFCRKATVNNVIQVVSKAKAKSDSKIMSITRVYTRAKLGPVNPLFSGAPMVLGGCLSGALGNPQLYPAVDGGVAIETKVSNGPSGSDCISPGALGLDADGAHSTDGTIEDTIPDAQDMWDFVFTKTRAEIQALAAEEVTAGISDSNRKYVWVTDTANFHRSIGSATNPAIVVFAASANCPKVNGGNTLYGIVFVDSDCADSNGFGGSEFYGSLVVDGLITKLTANTEFHHDDGVDTLKAPSFPEGFAPMEIGTWNDFDE